MGMALRNSDFPTPTYGFSFEKGTKVTSRKFGPGTVAERPYGLSGNLTVLLDTGETVTAYQGAFREA